MPRFGTPSHLAVWPDPQDVAKRPHAALSAPVIQQHDGITVQKGEDICGIAVIEPTPPRGVSGLFIGHHKLALRN